MGEKQITLTGLSRFLENCKSIFVRKPKRYNVVGMGFTGSFLWEEGHIYDMVLGYDGEDACRIQICASGMNDVVARKLSDFVLDDIHLYADYLHYILYVDVINVAVSVMDVTTGERVELTEESSEQGTEVVIHEYQDKLVSGSNIKTVNSQSLLGSGNVSVGTITGITMNGASKGTSGVVNLGTVITDVSTLAPKASPALTGTPTAPTAAAGTNTTQIATTAFVQSAVSGMVTSPTAGLRIVVVDSESQVGTDANTIYIVKQ